MAEVKQTLDLSAARRIADAVLYEGYVLYPYRASAQKNRLRWQFGIIAPRADSGAAGEPWEMQTECLLEGSADTVIHVRARFLQVQSRTVEQAAERGFTRVDALIAGDATIVPWEEGIEREVDAVLTSGELLHAAKIIPFEIAAVEKMENVFSEGGRLIGRIVRQTWNLTGKLVITAEMIDAPAPALKLGVRVENDSLGGNGCDGRDEALRRSFIGAHFMLGAEAGSFISLIDPPAWAAQAAAACANLRAWPVLVGDRTRRDMMLAAPIILYDYPEIAPESRGDFFDATEVDELLTLRTMTLTDEEKREARDTDARAAAILRRVDKMTPEIMGELHGAIRSRRQTAVAERPVMIDGVAVGPGSRVRLHPGARRADAQDMFL